MSVAFRRESDEEHLEPRFELPIPSGPNLVTRRGLMLIRARIAALEDSREREEEPRRVEIERDLRYWRARHASARPTPSCQGDEVGFGSRVRYRDAGGVTRTIEIVGHDEAAPASGLLAFSAPLARALIGAGAGDRIDFAGRAEAIEILEISSIDD